MDIKDLKLFIDSLTTVDEEKLIKEELDAVDYYKRLIDTHKTYFFDPYPFQMEMYKAGLEYRSRFACLANRIGKTYSAGQEVSYHLTGLYPTKETHGWDWPGIKYDEPVLLWAIGITSDSTRTVLQKEILGTSMAKALDEIGTGSIPRDCIDFSTMDRDGNTVRSVKIKHTSGGYSTLEFRSTQQGLQALMGQAVDFILLDEEDAYRSLEIFSQCLTRTATKEKGRVLITATPENGFSELIRKFSESEDLFIFHAGWNDAPHLSTEIKNDLLAGIPEWEIPMRTQGIPSKGSGAIFPFDDSLIKIPPLLPLPHWPVLAAVDFGKSRDPSIVMFIAKNDEGQYIVYDEVFLDQDRSVENIAKHILGTHTPNIPVIVPHDGNSGVEGLGNETRATILRELGCNVVMGTFSNPEFIQNQITSVHKKHMGKEGGLHWMSHAFKKGTLKVTENCSNFFRQKQSYFWVTRGGKTIPKDGNDDTIDAARYGVLSIDRYGVPFGQCHSSFKDFNNGFDNTSHGYEFQY